MLESAFALMTGITIGFVYDWRISLVYLVVAPLMAIGGAMNAKF